MQLRRAAHRLRLGQRDPALAPQEEPWAPGYYSLLFEDPDGREPGRTIELHLTGHMERFAWSFNGVKFSDAAPIELTYGERQSKYQGQRGVTLPRL